MAPVEELEEYLAGRALYGDDFGPAEIERWNADEKEAYAELYGRAEDPAHYAYHQLNLQHGFRHLPPRRFERVLGLGSAQGAEFAPVAERLGTLTIVEPSDAYAARELYGRPVRYVKPGPGGALPLADASFDLAVAFGALHHVPNVSFVVGELARCLEPGGWAVLRDPVVSMGDWRAERPGLTRRERGIPLPLFRDIVRRANLEIVRETLCVFRPLQRLWRGLGRRAYDEPLATRLDRALCALLAWNLRYHRRRWFQKLGPTSACFVLRRPSGAGG